MSLFISIVTALLIVSGTLAIIYRHKLRAFDEFGNHTGTAFGLFLITLGISIFLLVNGGSLHV